MFSSLQSELKGFMQLQHYLPLVQNQLGDYWSSTHCHHHHPLHYQNCPLIIIIITGQNEGSGYLLVELTLDT